MAIKKVDLGKNIWAAHHQISGPVICDPEKHIQGSKIVFRLWVCEEERFEPADRFQVLNDMVPLDQLTEEQTAALESAIEAYTKTKAQNERDTLNWSGVAGKHRSDADDRGTVL